MNEGLQIVESQMDELVNIHTLADAVAEIKGLVLKARSVLTAEVNPVILQTNLEIGRVIIEVEQNGNLRAQYEKGLLTALSKQILAELGAGYSRTNLANMRLLYLSYKKIQTESGQFSWSHYVELVGVRDKDSHSFYEHEAIYPLANQHVAIDLDDGIKASCNKFPRALRKVTGLSEWQKGLLHG